eukprot:jgi/Chlat1/9167/Chrsp97S08441
MATAVAVLAGCDPLALEVLLEDLRSWSWMLPSRCVCNWDLLHRRKVLQAVKDGEHQSRSHACKCHLHKSRLTAQANQQISCGALDICYPTGPSYNTNAAESSSSAGAPCNCGHSICRIRAVKYLRLKLKKEDVPIKFAESGCRSTFGRADVKAILEDDEQVALFPRLDAEAHMKNKPVKWFGMLATAVRNTSRYLTISGTQRRDYCSWPAPFGISKVLDCNAASSAPQWTQEDLQLLRLAHINGGASAQVAKTWWRDQQMAATSYFADASQVSATSAAWPTLICLQLRAIRTAHLVASADCGHLKTSGRDLMQ